MKAAFSTLVLTALVSGFALIAPSSTVQAGEPIRIEIGQNYDRYSNEELRRRVYDLERAVAQLQAEVFHLSVRDRVSAPPQIERKEWTCTIQSFGKTHSASAKTRAKALAQTLKKCSDATSSIHCEESDVKCGDE